MRNSPNSNPVRPLLGFVGIALPLLLAQPGWTLVVTLDPGPTVSRVFASTSDAGLNLAFPPGVPGNGSANVASASNAASTGYALSADALSIGFDHTLGSLVPGHLAKSSSFMFFSVDADVDFLISGSYTTVDPQGRTVELRVSLRELGGPFLFQNVQLSVATPNESLVVGETGGDASNILTGSELGTLQAGTAYEFLVSSTFRNDPASSHAVASGDVTLTFLTMLDVAIDIKPGSEVNPINLRSPGFVPVVLFGSTELDVQDVDGDTLAFGPGGAALVHVNGPHLMDVDEDGTDDLLTHFRIQETGLALEDTEACMTGELLDGTVFQGCDGVQVILACGLGAEVALLLPVLIGMRSACRRLRGRGGEVRPRGTTASR